MPKSMTISSPVIFGVGGDGVQRAVGADIVRLVDVERIGHAAAPCPAISGATPKYLLASTSRLWSARGTTVPMMTAVDVACGKPSSSSNWWSQTAYWSAVRRGSVAIRQRVRMLPALDQSEDDVGVPGVDREQHGAS